MSSEPTEKPKKVTFKIKFTKFELVHLRDLFGIVLPPELTTTISQKLAQTQNREYVESRLWQKIVTACTNAEIPLDDDAPDFMVAASSNPAVSVFELAHEPYDATEQDEPAGVFNEDPEETDEE